MQQFFDAIRSVAYLIAPISLASAVAVGGSAIMVIGSMVGKSGSHTSLFVWQWLKTLIGILPERKMTWGTIYDSDTKRPIPFAKVQLLDRNKRVLETRIADRNGRYGFLTTPASLHTDSMRIAITPLMKGYVFPSRAKPSVDTLVYNNLYRGGEVVVNETELINFDIPMDPIHASSKSLAAKSPSVALGISVAALADIGFWIGLLLVPLNFIVTPNPFTLGLVFLFLGLASLRIWNITEHPFGVILDQQTSRPIPFALITIDDQSGKRIAFTVSDERGRYVMTVPKGNHELTVIVTGNPPRQLKRAIATRRGWLTQKIRI